MWPDPETARAILSACAERAGVAGAQLSVVTAGGRVDVAWGAADAVAGRPLLARTRVQAGSFAKVLTAVLVHQLVDDGLIALSDPVCLPGLHDVEVGHLLSMTSGLDWGIWTAGTTVADALAPQLALPRRATPGTSFGYSFLSTLVAARIVELLRGASWAQCVRDRIAAPLGLALSAEPGPDDAPGHAATDGGWTLVDAPALPGMGPTGTTLRSSAADLATVAQALTSTDSPLLTAASRAALHREVVPVGAAMAADAWCHGPYARRIGRGHRLHGHGGRWAGGVSDVTWDAATGSVVAVTTATPGRGAALVLEVGRAVHRGLWGPDAAVDPVPVPPPTDLPALTGRYVTASRAYDVAVHGSTLTVRATTLPHPAAVFTLPDAGVDLVAVGPRRFLPAHETRDERRLQEFWFSAEDEPLFFYDGFAGARRAPAGV